jgi:hypothetical protein
LISFNPPSPMADGIQDIFIANNYSINFYINSYVGLRPKYSLFAGSNIIACVKHKVIKSLQFPITNIHKY